MTTANLYVLPKPLPSDQGLKEEHRVATGQPSFTRARAETEPETLLWKVCAETASPRDNGFEGLAFLVFGTLALGSLAYSFSELFRLLNSDGLDQTIRALLGTS